MINIIIADINKCIKHRCYFAALSLSLTLPDICGRAEYPNETSTKKRYIDWYDSNLGQYLKMIGVSDTKEFADQPYLSGEFVYSLRCGILHSGVTDIEETKITEERNKVTKFNLRYPKNGEHHIYGSDVTRSYAPDGTIQSRILNVDILEICKTISNVAEKYYNNNRDKFDFFCYNIIDPNNMN